MTLVPRIVITLFVALTAAACSRPQAATFHATSTAAHISLVPTVPEVPSCAWLGVVVDNALPARPQWGLSQADIVYEVPTEGMITRFLTLFCNSGPDTLGPVRSLRLQFLTIAHDYGATIAHSGSSESALEALTLGAGPVINEFWKARPFRRDHTRRMPHNLFTSVTQLRESVRNPHPRTDRLWETVDLAPSPNPMTITMPYGRGYTARFAYDPAAGDYQRFIEGQPARDPLTGDPIEVAAVIVQYAKWWQVYEGPVLTSRMALTGDGKITVFAGGRQTDGTWHRPDLSQSTQFADLQGLPIRLPPGRVWICLLPPAKVAQVAFTAPAAAR